MPISVFPPWTNNEQRQLDALQKFDIDKTFIDKYSGKNKNRPGLLNLLATIRPKDKGISMVTLALAAILIAL